jgi:hypothetical protein
MAGEPGGHPAGERLVLCTAIGHYPHTAAMRDGAVASDLLVFDFVDVPTIHQAFAPMVREQRTVFPDLEASAEAFRRKHGFVPVNHLVAVRSELARSRPDLILELARLFRQANIAAPHAGDRERYRIGRSALQPAVSLVLRYTAEQGLLPRRLDIDEVWEGLPAGLE